MDTQRELRVDRQVWQQIKAYARQFPNRACTLTFAPVVRHRTSPQLKYYQAVFLREYGASLGFNPFSKPEMRLVHEGLMRKHWPLPDRDVIDKHGVVLFTERDRRRRLTTKSDHGALDHPPLSQEEMSEYLDWLIVEAAEQGCIISEPRPKADVHGAQSSTAKSLAKQSGRAENVNDSARAQTPSSTRETRKRAA